MQQSIWMSRAMILFHTIAGRIDARGEDQPDLIIGEIQHMVTRFIEDYYNDEKEII